MKSFLLCAFFAASALAQPVVGPEVASTPIDGLGEIALAPQRDGFVIAWEAAGRVYAGHLDSSLQLTSVPLQLPITDPRETAITPAIATNGSTVLVAWREHYLGWPDWNAVATLTADASVLLSGPKRLNLSNTPALAGVANGTYVVYSDELKYGFNDALESTSFDSVLRGMSAAMSSDGVVATATHDQGDQLNCFSGFGGWGGGDCSFPVAYTFVVPSGTIVQRYSIPLPQGGTTPLFSPIVGANGSSFSALLRFSDKTDLLLFDTAIRLRSRLPFTITTPAALSGNGDDVLIVWMGQGVVLHTDGTLSQPFAIRAGSFANPHVVAVGSNDFVVFYTVDTGPNQKAIAGRFIHLQASKQRAIR